MSTPQLSCWQCALMRFDSGMADTDDSPGDPAIMECALAQWTISLYSSTQEEFRSAMATAATCPDFEDLKP